MLQMRQSMPNDLPCLRKYEVHPVHLPQMWVDCYPREDTNDSEGGEIMTMKCLICLTRHAMEHWNVCETCVKSIIHHYQQQNPEDIEVRWLNE